MGMTYLSDGIVTGSWNPNEQNKIINEERIAKEEIEARYAELENSIFGPNGYADRNEDGKRDGKVSPHEKVDAYRLMGLDPIIVLPARKPRIHELENAVYFMKNRGDDITKYIKDRSNDK